jgi:hypothetical protein
LKNKAELGESFKEGSFISSTHEYKGASFAGSALVGRNYIEFILKCVQEKVDNLMKMTLVHLQNYICGEFIAVLHCNVALIFIWCLILCDSAG